MKGETPRSTVSPLSYLSHSVTKHGKWPVAFDPWGSRHFAREGGQMRVRKIGSGFQGKKEGQMCNLVLHERNFTHSIAFWCMVHAPWLPFPAVKVRTCRDGGQEQKGHSRKSSSKPCLQHTAVGEREKKHWAWWNYVALCLTGPTFFSVCWILKKQNKKKTPALSSTCLNP